MKDKEKPNIFLFSDGGADPNPGKGGFGVILKFGNYEKEFSKGFERTTNNRMELQGIIYGLEQLKVPAIVTVYSDSKYVDRQLAMLNKLLGDFKGKLSTSKWAKMCKCSTDTALRDIKDLEEKGILVKEASGGRSTRYLLKVLSI